MPLKKLPYKNLRTLLANNLPPILEDKETEKLIQKLKLCKSRGYLTKDELKLISKWKSPRAIKHIVSNSPTSIKQITQKVFSTRSEKLKIGFLGKLKGVSIPMASAILMLTNPKMYPVIDIRVWQLLYELGSARKKPSGVGFTFKEWYQYLCIIRHYARKSGLTARDVERILFNFHKKFQKGNLYNNPPEYY